MDVRIAEIVIPPGRRAVSDTSVNALKNSIEQVGLLQAILLTPDLRLVAGAHRVAACKLLGHETIRAEIVDLDDLDRELAEIDENLIRNELTALERGEHLARRKAIYEALHPETRQGGLPGAPGGGKQAKTETISGFAEDAAEKTGVTDRAVRYAVQIGEDITPEARDAIRATPAAERRHVVAFRLRTGAKQTTTCRPFSNIRIGVISVSQEPPSGGFADSRRRRWAKTCPTKAL